MKLQEAIKVAEEYQKWCRGEPPYNGIGVDSPNAPKRIGEALDTLINHAKQPVQVTDEMVEAACIEYGAAAFKSPNTRKARIKAALQAALGGVSHD